MNKFQEFERVITTFKFNDRIKYTKEETADRKLRKGITGTVWSVTNEGEYVTVLICFDENVNGGTYRHPITNELSKSGCTRHFFSDFNSESSDSTMHLMLIPKYKWIKMK